MTALWRILKLPWLATVRPRGWWWSPLSLWAIWTMLLGNNAGNMRHVSWQRWGLVALMLAVATIWTLVPNALNLLRDSRMLGIPHARHESIRSLLAYALLTVVAPTLTLGVLFGHVLPVAVLLALAASAGAAWAVLPVWLIIVLMIPAVGAYILLMSGHIDLTLSHPGVLLAWAIPVALLLTAIDVQRWIVLQRVDATKLNRWQSPAVFNVGRARLSKLHGGAYTPSRFTNDSRKSRGGRLRNIGPEYPVRSLRAALHARIVPWGLVDKGRRSLSAQQAVALVVLCVALLAFFIDRRFGRTWLLQFASFGLMVAGILMAGYARMFWRHLNAASRGNDCNASLLALLPNMGPPARVRRNALLAWLQPDVHWTLGLGLVAAVMCLLLRVPSMVYAYLALMAAGGILTCAALTANTLGGTPLRPWLTNTVYPAGVALVTLTVFWGVQGTDSKPVSLHTPLLPAVVCAALWLAWLFCMAVLARRGWRALQRRPHPFFTDAS